ncbi:hypothetical protein ACS0TY_020381 [Phlomoides rotata]
MEAMEIGEEGSASMTTKNRKLTIEDYLDFIKNRDHQLNHCQLRKVISMHGFRGFGVQKSILLDVVKTINLMDLRRSTLKDGSVSGDACLTLKGVINDLNDLQWQECRVTSVIRQGAAATVSKGLGTKPVKVEADGSIVSTTGSTTVLKLKRLEGIIPTKGTTVAAGDSIVSEKGEKSKGLGKKSVEVAADDSIISTTGTTVAAGSTTVAEKGKKSKGLGKKSVEVAADDSIISTTGTIVAAGSTTVAEKRKKSKGLGKKSVEVAADDSIISTSSTTVSVKRIKSKGLGKKPVEDAADDSTISTECTSVAAGGTTVSVKRKRLKGLGMKPVVVAVAADQSIYTTTGTTCAAGSTT